MQTSELYSIINQFPSIKSHFKGVFAINKIPKYLKVKQFIIANTENDFEPGQHWFCLLKSKSNEYEYFDSLGVTQSKIEKLQSHKIFKKNCFVKYNESSVQTSTSSNCGLFVLYFLINRMHNLDLSFSCLLDEIFESENNKNEEIVLKFAEENFTF